MKVNIFSGFENTGKNGYYSILNNLKPLKRENIMKQIFEEEINCMLSISTYHKSYSTCTEKKKVTPVGRNYLP